MRGSTSQASTPVVPRTSKCVIWSSSMGIVILSYSCALFLTSFGIIVLVVSIASLNAFLIVFDTFVRRVLNVLHLECESVSIGVSDNPSVENKTDRCNDGGRNKVRKQ